MKFLLALVIAALLGLPAQRTADSTAVIVEQTEAPEDPRVEKLEAFFDHYHCPEPHYAEEYIQAADESEIDFRLLPAISVIESSCGRHFRLNNYWGWNSARTGFGSVREGIRFVSGQLGSGHYYAGKSTEAKLRTYNSANPAYVPTVLDLMKQIDEAQ